MIDKIPIHGLYPRESYESAIMAFVGKPLVKILNGIRRCGKSSVLALVAKRLSKTVPEGSLIYLNMESLDNARYADIGVLHEMVKERYMAAGGKISLFIDEIQEIPGWEKAVNSFLADNLADIFISGSNSRLLSGELATRLSGRYVEQNLYPLTFSEFCRFRALSRSSDTDSGKWSDFNDFLKYGGFPGIHHLEFNENVIYQYLASLADSVILKDVILRHRIRDVSLLRSLLLFLADNCGSIFSARSIGDYLKKERRSLGVETVYNYLSYLETAFVIYKVPRFDVRGKRILETHEKYYLADIGLRHALLGFRERDAGILLENIVFIELKKRSYNVTIGKMDDLEIDFIATRGDEKTYIQVAYMLTDALTRERELRPLKLIADNHPKYVLTMDRTPPGNDEGIKRLYLPDWLSREDL